MPVSDFVQTHQCFGSSVVGNVVYSWHEEWIIDGRKG
jgi:hypothetical protein